MLVAPKRSEQNVLVTRRRIKIDFAFVLHIEIASWENARNEPKAQIRWKFTVDEAREAFKQYYPTSLAS